nr:hypothetical protein [Bradyrhizobium lablabi]
MSGQGVKKKFVSKLEPQPAIRTGVTASAIAHLSILALVLYVSDVHPFHSVTAETIAVDIVTPQEVVPETPKPPEPAKSPLDFSSLAQQTASDPAPSAPRAAPPPSPQAVQPPGPDQSQRQVAAAPKAMVGASVPGYAPAQPDLTVKYNIALGLPPELPMQTAASDAGQKSEDGYDASTTSVKADVSSSVVAEFRRHLKTCAKLPASVAPSDNVLVKLRVFLTQEGRLAGDPAVGGGSANVKAIELLQSAIAALKACQPYAMLPPDRYGEWKALDLVFTPKDFSGG